MLRSKVGWSKAPDSYAAGKEAALKAKEGINPKVAFLFGSVDYNAEQLMSGVKETLPGVAVLGCTSFTGILTPDGFIGGDKGFCGIMALDDPDMQVSASCGAFEGCAVQAGETAANKVLKKAGRTDAPDFFYMFAPPGKEEFYLQGIQNVIGRVPFAGGSAADNSLEGKWLVYG